MRLFAIIVSINRETLHVLARNFVESFLIQEFSQKLAKRYLVIFDEYSEELALNAKGRKDKKISTWSVKILGICNQIVNELHIRQRFMILLSLIRFSRYFSDVSIATSDFSNTISDVVRTVADGLLITEEEYENCTAFITDKFYNVPQQERILIVIDDPEFIEGEIKHVQKDNLSGQIFVLKIQRADIFLFQYVGKAHLECNGQYIFPRHVYLLPRGGSIRGQEISPIYYSDIISGYITYTDGHQVDFLAKNIEFHFKNSANGIRQFCFHGRSGQLVGIMGGSGTGKSTLLKVLNGSLKLDRGDIYINGHHLVKEAEALEGMIGYIPQDDLLIEELTVYQNLYFNARLCLNGYTEGEINETVEEVLSNLDLFESRNLKVGTPLNKYISGGQRKRLNIALELIREPYILFVDEPTSGLSSTDSENVVALLKEQALKGKLVMANIHQPSSELFKQFDHLLVLDRGGYPVYSGNPIESISYFKQLAERVDAMESECRTCGRSNPDEILQIIEARDVNELGEFTSNRKTTPEQWYRNYREKIESGKTFSSDKTWIPYNKYLIPGAIKQFSIFFRRNLLSKLADRQFMSIALLVSPLLAVILGFFSKYVAGDDVDPHRYIFSQNENLPAFLFMSVVVALFLGMIVAAEEIIKDRKIQERESFLKLNRSAYLLSKISLLFILSGIQMLLFVIIGNLIMEIKGLTFSSWLILFSTACYANLLGLNISDGLKSVVAIYIIVPFLLVPQILLAGVIVKFDKLHYKFASHQAVPVSADLMASRWAYEALTVNQFVNNEYQDDFFDLERLESSVIYDLQFLIPTLIQEIQDATGTYIKNPAGNDLTDRLGTIRDGMGSIFLTDSYPGLQNLYPEQFSISVGRDAIRWLKEYQSGLSTYRERLSSEKDALIDSLKQAAGGAEELLKKRRTYLNNQVADLVLNRNEFHKIVKKDGILLRKMEPIYMYPVKKNGRAHFYASVKRLGSYFIPTLVFNLIVLWIMSIVLYFLLRYSVLQTVIDFFGRNRQMK